ncbi:MAG: hypothetical protein ACFFDP_01610 [Promethearchaeota archaeon]
MASQMLQLFETLTKRVNENQKHRDFLRKWVGKYYGKIIQLETDEDTLHIIIHKRGTMQLEKGSYPSPDIIYKAKTQTLMNLFTGRADFRDLMKRWEIIIIGAAHESVPLAQLLFNVLQSS